MKENVSGFFSEHSVL